MGRLDKKVAVITGGAGGIGRAAGKLFVEEGADVLLVDLDEEALAAAVQEIGSNRISYFVADVTSQADNQAMIAIIRSGRNPTMRHLPRVHRISIAWLHERLGNPETKDNVDLIDTDTEHMAADIYTKAFTDPQK